MARQVYCIYHNADFDGIGSAAVVNHYHKELGDKVQVYGWNYGAKLPPYETFDNDGIVYMVDVVFPIEDMKKLLSKYKQNFVWIDHHASAKADFAALKINAHLNLEQAAIKNCWDYFYPYLPFPKGLQLIADYDIWKLSEENKQFNYALFSNPEYKKPKYEIWGKIIRGDEEIVDKLVAKGEIIQDYVRENQKKIMQSAHLVKFADYTVPALNSNVQGSEIFEANVKNLYEKYPFVVLYYKVITGWKLSLFTNRKDINLIEIAKDYGFKGHKTSCGAMLEKLPFEFLNLPVDKS